MRSLKKQAGFFQAIIPWIPAIAAGIGGLLGNKGQRSANQANSALSLRQMEFEGEQAAINRDFTSAQAQRQMDFQEVMASTQHSREIADLKAAGLNPILSASQGGPGAAAPGGAQGAGTAARGSTATMLNAKAVGINTALQVARATAEIRNIQAQTDLTGKKAKAIGPASEFGEDTVSLYEYLKARLPTTAKKLKQLLKDYQDYFSGSLSENQFKPQSPRHKGKNPTKRKSNPLDIIIRKSSVDYE